MHIPDGFVNGATAAPAAVAAAGGIALALRRARDTLGDRQIALAGLVAAFVFAAQMVNFPVAGGTSGHLVGGVLAAVILGPWAAVVVMAVVVVVQSLFFADGGLTALGLNVINMAIIAPLAGYAVFAGLRRLLPPTRRAVVSAAGLAAGVSVVFVALGFVAEYAIGGPDAVPIGTVLGAMVGVHTLIGVGEGLITASIVAAVLATRPDVVYGARGIAAVDSLPARQRRLAPFVIGGALVAVIVAVGASQFASNAPDGLERVAIDEGLAADEVDHPLANTPLADYGGGLFDGGVGTAVAGLVGTLVVLGVGFGVFRVARRRRRSAEQVPDRISEDRVVI